MWKMKSDSGKSNTISQVVEHTLCQVPVKCYDNRDETMTVIEFNLYFEAREDFSESDEYMYKAVKNILRKLGYTPVDMGRYVFSTVEYDCETAFTKIAKSKY